MLPGINKDYGILKAKVLTDDKEFCIEPIKALPVSFDIVEDSELLYPHYADYTFELGVDVDRMSFKDIVNDRITELNSDGLDIVDSNGCTYHFNLEYKHFLKKPKHRVKKGKKYIWKYKNSEWLLMQGATIKEGK